MEKQRKSRRRKRKRKRKSRLPIVFLIIVIAIIVLFISPVFAINTINCEGNNYLQRDQIIEASGIKMGSNIFLVSFNSARNAIFKLPYIDEVYLKRSYPNTINILVTESKETAIIETANSYLVINAKGKILSDKDNIGNLELPVIKGVSSENFVVGEKFGNSLKDERLLDCLSSLIHNNLLSQVTIITINDLGDVIINIENRINVVLGENKFDSRISHLKVILEQLELEDPDQRGDIDFTNDEMPAFRPK